MCVFWLPGFKQVINPLYTLQTIFNINHAESYALVRELGYSNICKGLAEIISFFLPQWRIVAAFIGGLYFGMAGIQHLIKKHDSPNESIAISDIFLCFIMDIYIVHCDF